MGVSQLTWTLYAVSVNMRGRCHPDGNSAVSVSGQQNLASTNLGIVSVSVSAFSSWSLNSSRCVYPPLRLTSRWLWVPQPHHVFSPLLIKYNIYFSLFEFTHPYHWVFSPWLWGGLVEDSLTLHRSWNMHITIKGDGRRESASAQAHATQRGCVRREVVMDVHCVQSCGPITI